MKTALWPSGHLWYCIPITNIKKHQCAVSSLRLDFLKLQPQTWGMHFNPGCILRANIKVCFLKHCSFEFFTHVFMCYLHFQVWHCAFLYYSTESLKSLKHRCGHQFSGLEPIFVPPQCSVSHLPANQEQDCLSPCLFSSFLYRARLSQAYRLLYVNTWGVPQSFMNRLWCLLEHSWSASACYLLI